MAHPYEGFHAEIRRTSAGMPLRLGPLALRTVECSRLPAGEGNGKVRVMVKRVQKCGRGQSGQAMVEYVIVFAILLGVVAGLSLCLYVVRQQSNRALDLVASEYP